MTATAAWAVPGSTAPTPAGAVVAAVGPDGGEAGVAFAAHEARLRHETLHLVHVVRPPALGETTVELPPLLRDEADAVLARAVEHARAEGGPVLDVTAARLDGGTRWRQIRDAAVNASLLVLQHRDLAPGRWLWAGSTTARVAARTPVPLVSVPRRWHDVPDGSDPRPVVVAVHHVEESAALLLRVAADFAVRRHAALRVVHAWSPSTGLDLPVIDEEYVAQRAAVVRARLLPMVRDLSGRHPGLAVDVDVENEPPVEGLLAAADRAQALVVGRRHPLLSVGSHLGPVARSLLDRGRCPVLVVPGPPHDLS